MGRDRLPPSDPLRTAAAPLARWTAAGPFPLPSTDALAEAFLWEEQRTVTRTALVSLQGNTYQVDPLLVGRRVELVFDPFDLTRIQVRLRGVPAGTAIPHRIGRHAHLKARPETPPELPAPTGIDYARLIAEIHQTQLGTPGTGVNYAALAGSAPAGNAPAGNAAAGNAPADSAPADSNTPTSSNDQLPGQLNLLTDGPVTDGPVTDGGVVS
jgi:Mu transposase, C-terminal